jgi:hypothetical protein
MICTRIRIQQSHANLVAVQTETVVRYCNFKIDLLLLNTPKFNDIHFPLFDLDLPVIDRDRSFFFLTILTNRGTTNFKTLIRPPAIPINVVTM